MLEKESPEERDLFYAAMWYKRLKDHPELAKDRVRRSVHAWCWLVASHIFQPSWTLALSCLPALARARELVRGVANGALTQQCCLG